MMAAEFVFHRLLVLVHKEDLASESEDLLLSDDADGTSLVEDVLDESSLSSSLTQGFLYLLNANNIYYMEYW